MNFGLIVGCGFCAYKDFKIYNLGTGSTSGIRNHFILLMKVFFTLNILKFDINCQNPLVCTDFNKILPQMSILWHFPTGYFYLKKKVVIIAVVYYVVLCSTVGSHKRRNLLGHVCSMVGKVVYLCLFN